MAEYPTGTTGRIYIEDTGSTVNISIDAHQGATNVGQGGYSWADPLGSGNSTYSYPAGSGKKLLRTVGPFGAGQGGNLRFTLDATGTQGLGGPTTVNFTIERAPAVTPPSAPQQMWVVGSTQTTVTVGWMEAFANGGTIDLYSPHISTDNFATTDTYYQVNGSAREYTFTGLVPGVQYWFRCNAHNQAGWGPMQAPPGPAFARSGVHVSDGVAWRACQVLVSDGSAWVEMTPQHSSGTAWGDVK